MVLQGNVTIDKVENEKVDLSIVLETGVKKSRVYFLFDIYIFLNILIAT